MPGNDYPKKKNQSLRKDFQLPSPHYPQHMACICKAVALSHASNVTDYAISVLPVFTR